MYSDTALDVAEREFLRLVPDPLRLERGDAAPAFDRAALPGVVWPLDLLAARTLLLAPGTDRAVKDAVWRVVIARARMSQDWMCGAIGLAMPALKGCARRCTRGLTPPGVEEVDAEILAGFIAAVREIRTDFANLAWYLRCRAQRAGLRSRRRLLEQAGAEVGDHDAPAANSVASGGGHPDLLLERAVSRGVLSLAEADLIGATRLEKRRFGMWPQHRVRATGRWPSGVPAPSSGCWRRWKAATSTRWRDPQPTPSPTSAGRRALRLLCGCLRCPNRGGRWLFRR
ncbi:hypothetical protein ACFPZ0_00610 [Streptomonospora nanhaiensis]|uniref:hypothetical protein n=1 Tax=Streptomonospora nanhaiensis TaxID=1323731 RepID=UPI001FEC9784|nr:hypothetical protein [Streptomonospora nanhaiensis]